MAAAKARYNIGTLLASEIVEPKKINGTINLMYDQLYWLLYLIRRVEEEISKVYPSDKIKSPVHLSIGQEAVAVGACAALRADDIVFATYRSHAAYLAKGGDLKQMIAELYGKVTGCARGKGGSMHLIDIPHGVMGTSAVVGTTIANAVGYAYALKMQRRNHVVLSFFGDGATEEGVFHESMNFAALKGLPIIFVCENNQYAIHTHQSIRQSNPNIWERAKAYGLPAERIENNDVVGVYERIRDTATAIRDNNQGPYFFECMTARWYEHVGPGLDFYLGYRSQTEVQPWIDQDQMSLIGKTLQADTKQAIEAGVEREIREAFAFAEESPFPDVAELYTQLYA